jgi:hypothetical protein
MALVLSVALFVMVARATYCDLRCVTASLNGSSSHAHGLAEPASPKEGPVPTTGGAHASHAQLCHPAVTGFIIETATGMERRMQDVCPVFSGVRYVSVTHAPLDRPPNI